jgi:STE24 endopeptidase
MSLAWKVLLLVSLVVSGFSLTLRAIAERVAPSVGSASFQPITVVVYVVLLSCVNEVVGLGLAFRTGYLVERHYGLSTEPITGWLRDQIKAFGLSVVFASLVAAALYQVMAWSPAYWWLTAALGAAALMVGLTQVMPIVVLPLFYRVKPLEKASLRARLVALADRAGARVLGAYEWGLGGRTKKANAALAGIGATRRILVSDTMLAEYSDEEIEVVLAHELAHHVHGDIWKGLLFESALIVCGFYLSARVLAWLSRPLGLRSVTDVAGLPLLLLTAGAVSLVMVPVAHALSRAYERKADRFALDLTRNPAAFISAMRRLGAQNLAEEDPSPLVQWLFYTHPPLRERIAAAQAFSDRSWVDNRR